MLPIFAHFIFAVFYYSQYFIIRSFKRLLMFAGVRIKSNEILEYFIFTVSFYCVLLTTAKISRIVVFDIQCVQLFGLELCVTFDSATAQTSITVSFRHTIWTVENKNKSLFYIHVRLVR